MKGKDTNTPVTVSDGTASQTAKATVPGPGIYEAKATYLIGRGPADVAPTKRLTAP